MGGGSVSGDSQKASTISHELNTRSCIKHQAIFSELIYFLFVSDICRQIEFDHFFDGKRLKNHVIRTVDVTGERSCRTLCYMEPNCVSYNFNKVTKKCELNNSTFREGEENMESNPGYIYCGAKVCKVLHTMKLCKKRNITCLDRRLFANAAIMVLSLSEVMRPWSSLLSTF